MIRWIPITLRWAAALIILAIGTYSLDFRLVKTAAFGLLLFVVPTLGQLLKSPALRAYSIWFGVFVLFQTFAGPLLLGHRFDFVSLPPNLDDTLVVAEGRLPGIVGTQHITTDEKGFRVNPRIDYGHKTGLRIFAIGGSTTEDLSLDDERTWPYLLQERLRTTRGPEVNVVNAGVSGLRARNHVATLEEIIKYQPDIVLFLIGFNDWSHDVRYHFGSRKIEETNRPRFDNSPLGRMVQALGTAVLHTGVQHPRVIHIGEPPPGFFYAGPQLHTNSLARATKYEYIPGAISQEYSNDLERISRTCKTNRITCLFITQPSGYRRGAQPELKQRFWLTAAGDDSTVTFDSMVAIAELYNSSLIAFANSRDHPSCDIAPKIAPTLDNFFDDAHYNDAGAQRVAELVAECMVSIVEKRGEATLHPSGAGAKWAPAQRGSTREIF